MQSTRRGKLNDLELPLPHDFSNWQIGEDATSGVEVAVLELIDQAQDKTLILNWPDFSKLTESVEALVRDKLSYAFQVHRSGFWQINFTEKAPLQWMAEGRYCDEYEVWVELGPRAMIPLIIGNLSENLSTDDDEFEWQEKWLRALQAAKEWQKAIQASVNGLKALQSERQDILRHRASLELLTPPLDEAENDEDRLS